MQQINVSETQALNILAQLAPDVRPGVTYFSNPDSGEVLLSFPDDLAAAVEAADPDSWKARLEAYAADLRWRREVGGINVGGVSVSTDDRAKLMITGARVAAAADPSWSTVWYGADGATYPLDAAAMIAISDAVQAHVNASFSSFATIKAGIGAGTITSTAEIDAAFGAEQ